jgi:hypothetical protein
MGLRCSSSCSVRSSQDEDDRLLLMRREDWDLERSCSAGWSQDEGDHLAMMRRQGWDLERSCWAVLQVALGWVAAIDRGRSVCYEGCFANGACKSGWVVDTRFLEQRRGSCNGAVDTH